MRPRRGPQRQRGLADPRDEQEEHGPVTSTRHHRGGQRQSGSTSRPMPTASARAMMSASSRRWRSIKSQVADREEGDEQAEEHHAGRDRRGGHEHEEGQERHVARVAQRAQRVELDQQQEDQQVPEGVEHRSAPRSRPPRRARPPASATSTAAQPGIGSHQPPQRLAATTSRPPAPSSRSNAGRPRRPPTIERGQRRRPPAGRWRATSARASDGVIRASTAISAHPRACAAAAGGPRGGGLVQGQGRQEAALVRRGRDRPARGRPVRPARPRRHRPSRYAASEAASDSAASSRSGRGGRRPTSTIRVSWRRLRLDLAHRERAGLGAAPPVDQPAVVARPILAEVVEVVPATAPAQRARAPRRPAGAAARVERHARPGTRGPRRRAQRGPS